MLARLDSPCHYTRRDCAEQGDPRGVWDSLKRNTSSQHKGCSAESRGSGRPASSKVIATFVKYLFLVKM